MQEFKVNIPDETLAKIKAKVAAYPWDEVDMPSDGGWVYGTNKDYLKELCDYWVNSFDWRKAEAKMNKFPQFKAMVDGQEMHFIWEKGSGNRKVPLLITHGWPGSFIEFLDIIEPLAHPERFGGKAEDGFDIISPSLPGFGFSGHPEKPMGPRRMAEILNKLVTEVCGYDKYIAQGGDWGSVVSNWIAYDYPEHCCGLHVNCAGMRHAKGPQTPEEIEWQERLNRDQITENGYRTQQATKPQTLAYAMADSPVGVAAWILEKFHTWSDIKNNDVETAHSKDTLLTNIMVYIVTKTFNTASWVYYGRRIEGEGMVGTGDLEKGGRVLGADGKRIEVPTACALFPAEMLEWPPRSYCERMYNIVRWNKMEYGGHFAALENPKALLNDVREFALSITK